MKTLSKLRAAGAVFRIAVGALVALLCLAGVLFARNCGTDRPYTATIADWPLFFTHHQFGAVCFDTQSCAVRYNDFNFGTEQPTRPRSSIAPGNYDSLMSASYGPVARTAPPARVKWTSKDGTALETIVDISEIFKDTLIRHNTPREEIAKGVSMGSTHILLEIDDRTINVYTRTMIPLKKLLDPANRYSSFRNDLIKVFTQTN